MARKRRFPHTTARWKQVGRDGVEYQVTAKYYVAVLGAWDIPGNPQDVWFHMLIEGPNGYRRELRGDKQIRPVILRRRAELHQQHATRVPVKCSLCRQEIRQEREAL